MSSNDQIPKINNRIVCIVDRDAKELAAIVSSYSFEGGTYTPLFLFGRAQVPRSEDSAFMSEGYVAYLMVENTSVLIHNALARMGGCEYVVFAGLSDHQKTYLRFPKSQKIIEITQASEVQAKLGPLVTPKGGELRCKSSEILSGLYLAQKQRKILVIDANAQTLPTNFIETTDGLILVEDVEKAGYDAEVPQGMREQFKLGNNHYSFAVRMSMAKVLKWRMKYNHTEPIHFAFDQLTKGRGEIDAIFNEALKEGDSRALAHGISREAGWSFQSKARVLPLQGADILAWESLYYMRKVYLGNGKMRRSFQALLDGPVERGFHDGNTLRKLVAHVKARTNATW